MIYNLKMDEEDYDLPDERKQYLMNYIALHLSKSRTRLSGYQGERGQIQLLDFITHTTRKQKG